MNSSTVLATTNDSIGDNPHHHHHHHHFEGLPEELRWMILGGGFLQPRDLVHCGRLNRSFRRYFHDPDDAKKRILWKQLLQRENLPGKSFRDLQRYISRWEDYRQALLGALYENVGISPGQQDDTETRDSIRKFLAEAMINYVKRTCNAHSWYKHLPIVGDTVYFGFVLDLTSRMRSIDNEWVDYTDDDGTRFHYTWTTTADYRKRFGHLRYTQYDSGETNDSFVIVDWIQRNKTNGGKRRVLVPKSQMGAFVEVTAVVHDCSPGWELYDSVFRAAVEERDPGLVKRPISARLGGMGAHVEGHHKKLPAAAACDLERLVEAQLSAPHTTAQVVEDMFRSIHPNIDIPPMSAENPPRAAQYAQLWRERLAMAQSMWDLCCRTYGESLAPDLLEIQKNVV